MQERRIISHKVIPKVNKNRYSIDIVTRYDDAEKMKYIYVTIEKIYGIFLI